MLWFHHREFVYGIRCESRPPAGDLKWGHVAPSLPIHPRSRDRKTWQVELWKIFPLFFPLSLWQLIMYKCFFVEDIHPPLTWIIYIRRRQVGELGRYRTTTTQPLPAESHGHCVYYICIRRWIVYLPFEAMPCKTSRHQVRYMWYFTPHAFSTWYMS